MNTNAIIKHLAANNFILTGNHRRANNVKKLSFAYKPAFDAMIEANTPKHMLDNLYRVDIRYDYDYKSYHVTQGTRVIGMDGPDFRLEGMKQLRTYLNNFVVNYNGVINI